MSPRRGEQGFRWPPSSRDPAEIATGRGCPIRGNSVSLMGYTERKDRWIGFKRRDVRVSFEDAGLMDVGADCVGADCRPDSESTKNSAWDTK